MNEHTLQSRRVVIVTDLDGTLLHHSTYSFEAAGTALELLRQRGIPLVICSSKTRAEIELYRERLGNIHPFISENGGGIYIPEKYFPFLDMDVRDGYMVRTLGTPYALTRQRFVELRDRLRVTVRGFGDMTIEEIVDLTGLSREEAPLAQHRDFSEPFVFSGPPDDRFLREIEASGMRWTQGRLFHFMGDHHKGRAVNMLRTLYERHQGPVELIGLGDSLNDLPFLLAVDRPVLVKRPDGTHDPRIALPGLIKTSGIGPAGWNDAVLELLK